MDKLPVPLQPGEHLVQLLRRHPVYTVGHIALVVLTAAAVTVALWLLSGLLPALAAVWDILLAATAILAVGSIALRIYRYLNDLWMVTNQRLIDYTRRSPFSQKVATADLQNVQDIAIEKVGVLATLFDFGDVRCQTASVSQLFVFEGVPKPNRVLDTVDQARDAARQPRQLPSHGVQS